MTGTLADTVGQYNPFRYRSYYYDAETGLYYLQSRYYDPEVGRFINADGIVGANGGIQAYNLFAYCSNNPVVYTDILGMCPHNAMYDCKDCTAAKLSGTYNESQAQVLPKSTGTYYNDEFEFAVSYLGSLSNVAVNFALKLEEYIVKGATRPNNIGIGLFQKWQAKELASIAKTRKVVGEIGVTSSIVFDVGIGVYYNIENNSGFDKIVYDMGVDLAISGGTALAEIAVGAIAGSACCPVVGTIAGVGVSVIGYVVFDYFGLRDSIKSFYE